LGSPIFLSQLGSTKPSRTRKHYRGTLTRRKFPQKRLKLRRCEHVRFTKSFCRAANLADRVERNPLVPDAMAVDRRHDITDFGLGGRCEVHGIQPQFDGDSLDLRELVVLPPRKNMQSQIRLVRFQPLRMLFSPTSIRVCDSGLRGRLPFQAHEPHC